MRYEYASFKSWDRAESYLEYMFAAGEVSWCESPRIEARHGRYVITLAGC